MRFRFPSILLLAVLALVPANSLANEPEIRVLIAEGRKSATLTVKGEYTVKSLPALKLLHTGKRMEKTALTPTKKGIKLGSSEWPVSGVRIESEGERDLFLDKARFRGSFDIQKDGSGSLSIVNRLNIESYLYGVLPHEVAAWWPMEALKAQAIAARTYALYQMQVSKNNPYDVKNTTSSQVYGGSTSERYRTKLATNQTAGKVLTYLGKVFPAYFHATCGGTQAGAQELWKINLLPIGGGAKCTFCRISPHYYWEAKIPFAEIEEKLNANKRSVGQLLNIEAVTQTPSGRAGSLKFTGNMGEAVIAAKDFRIWVGGNRIRSTAFSIEVSEDAALFHGRGWGHGVGLCQWGSLGQALLGRHYKDILNLYYPQAKIENYEA